LEQQVMGNREWLKNSRRWVIKIGSALLTDEGKGLDRSLMQKWVEQIVALRESGIKVTLVSSGAVAEGMLRLGWEKRPGAIHELQAAAAVGQMGLIQAYESNFLQYGVKTAQILLTHEDLTSRTRYLNARSTLWTLIDLGVIPIVNENDTVVTDEIRFGDNDTLAALVANLIEAEVMVILTDQKGLFDADPRNHPQAELISTVKAGDPHLEVISSSGKGKFGCGGMLTKVRAAERAARSGAATLIAHGREENVLQRLMQGERLGTLFEPCKEAFSARKLWIANQLKPKGTLELDEGAVKVLTLQGKSLLPIGVVSVSGSFQRGEVVTCIDSSGKEIARGLVNYSASDTKKIIRKPTDQIESVLGFQIEPELIHRNNMVLMLA
jgi:glutamate 5-kinase